MAYSVFVASATLVALQSDCFMQMMSRTATSEGKAVEALFRRLSQTEPENGPEKEYQNFFEPVVCVSELVTGSVKFLSFKCG